MTTLRARLLVFALIAILAVGCESDDNGADRDAVLTAANKTLEADTALLEGGLAGVLNASLRQRVDFSSDRGRGSITFEAAPGIPPGTEADLYVDGSRELVRFGGNDFWVELAPDPLASVSNRPSALLTLLDTALTDIERAGEQTVGGESAVKYEGTYRLAELIELAPPEAQADAEAMLQEAEPELPAEVYIGDDGYIRRITLEFTTADPGLSAVIDFSRLGQPAKIGAPPPPRQVIPESELSGPSPPTPP